MDGGPVYVVLGATGGIGSALCRRLESRGARLVLGARGEQRLAALAEELRALPVPLDARQWEQTEACVARAVEAHGRLDGLACCIGSLLLKSAHLTTEEEWADVVAENLTTAFGAVRAGARAMQRGGGAIALVSAAVARAGLAHHEAISAVKAGVEGLVRSAAATYARAGVRVNAAAPGLVRTPLTAAVTESETAMRASLALHPLGRVGEPADVASVLDWLLHPEQSWVTGQVIAVDGGLSELRARQAA